MLAEFFPLLIILIGLFVIVPRINSNLEEQNIALKLEIEDLKLEVKRLSEELELLELSRDEMLRVNFKTLSNNQK